MTILQCEQGKRCAKLYTDPEQAPDGYDAGWLFKPEARAVSSISDLFDVLNELCADSSKMVIRGRLRDGTERTVEGYVARRCKDDEFGPAPFESTPRRYMMLDVDASDIPFDASNPRACVEAWRATLSEGLRGAAMVVQFSASQHRSETLKVHAWIWLADGDQLALDDHALASWARRKGFDAALLRPVQPHYTADPVFEGCADPLAPRELLFFDGYEAWLDVISADLTPRAPSSTKSGKIDVDEIDEPSGEPVYVDADARICELLAEDIKANCQDTLCAVAGMARKAGWPAPETLQLLRDLAEYKYTDEAAEQRCAWAMDPYVMAQPERAAGFKALTELACGETATAVQAAIDSASKRKQAARAWAAGREQREALKPGALAQRKPRKPSARRPRVVLTLNGVSSVPDASPSVRVRKPKLVLTLKVVQS
ncbi:MAG: hypothetical protein WDO74_37455 [Pseudomonadota bacterium]